MKVREIGSGSGRTLLVTPSGVRHTEEYIIVHTSSRERDAARSEMIRELGGEGRIDSIVATLPGYWSHKVIETPKLDTPIIERGMMWRYLP